MDLNQLAHLKSSIKNIINTTIKREGIDKLSKYLDDNFFYTQGMNDSSQDDNVGALADHSYNVYLIMSKMNSTFKLNIRDESLAIVSLFHDISRIKNEDQFIAGHAEKSVFILQQFINLTDEEIMAINCHMGGKDSRHGEFNEFDAAVYTNPIVMCLYLSDMLSCLYGFRLSNCM